MKTIETYLPVFPGFYSTIFEPDETSEIEYFTQLRIDNKLTPVDFDQFQFDYDNYRKRISKDCCGFIERELKALNVLDSITFQSVYSPKEYNFATDAIYIAVNLTDENVEVIKKYLQDNIESFTQYVKDRYTSYDGFMSSYSNNVNAWLFDECLEHKHMLGPILEFICRNEDINSEDMYYYASQDNYLEVENANELEFYEFCNACGSFVSPTHYKGNCCTDCFEQAIGNTDIIVCRKCHLVIVNEHEKRHLQHAISHGELRYSDVICSDCEQTIQ